MGLSKAFDRRALHLTAGLIMLTFITSHLINHALGIISIDAMEAGIGFLLSPWTNAMGVSVLTAAAFYHMGSALWVIYGRRTLKLPAWQWTQLVTGLSVPILVADHAINTGYAETFYGLEPSYAYILAGQWVLNPAQGWLQMTLLIVAWVHAMVGLRNWLRFKAWWPEWAQHLYALSVVIPVLAIAGYVSAGLRVQTLAEDPGWLSALYQAVDYPGDATIAALDRAAVAWIIGFIALTTAVFIARYIRIFVESRRDYHYVTYGPTGERIRVQSGATLLEMLQDVGIRHASVCGGRARCSTCRVRLSELSDNACPAPSAEERHVLAMLGLPPDVRLACQTRPVGDIVCEPLLPPDVTTVEALRPGAFTAGHEVELTVLFADLRGFTKLSESKLPFDVVYLLNQYFENMGHAIEAGGGVLDKFIGDGIMATFDGEANAGAKNALAAAAEMGRQLDAMNERLKNDLKAPLNIGIGLHTGTVIRGTMGYGPARQVTVIGDAVNTASRLESATKDLGVQLLFSEPVCARAGINPAQFDGLDLQVRGRQATLRVYKAAKAADVG